MHSDADGTVAVGYYALKGFTTGYSNTVMVVNAGDAITIGYENAIFGQGAGGSLTDGHDNVIIGASAGACSCGPIAFTIITTFGTAGSVASSFVTVYEIPIRLISIFILCIVIFVTSKSLSRECKIISKNFTPSSILLIQKDNFLQPTKITLKIVISEYVKVFHSHSSSKKSI